MNVTPERGATTNATELIKIKIKRHKKGVKLAQTPHKKGKLSQFLRLNSPKALVLTAIIPPPPSSRAKPDKPSGLMNVISISDNHKPPTPTVYTEFHTVGLVGNCREQGHS